MLLLAFVAPMAFTSCNNGDPEIEITVKSDYGKIIEAIGRSDSAV